MKQFVITEDQLNPADYRDAVLHPSAGAVVLFTGHVREWTNNIQTKFLIYEAYVLMAEKTFAQIAVEVSDKWENTRVAIGHRIGLLNISDIAVVIAVSAPHRKSAYEANEFVINRVKKIVPIWKKEKSKKGGKWIG